MTIRRRRCATCGQYFAPPQDNHYLCPQCFRDSAPLGYTQVGYRPGAASHRHGGESNLRPGRRSLIWRGGHTATTVLAGFERFLSDLSYRKLTLNQLFDEAGLAELRADLLEQPGWRQSIVMLFCPELREWLIDAVRYNTADLLIEYYRLYGDEAITIQKIAYDQGLEPEHAERRRLWALEQLRGPGKHEGLLDVLRRVVRHLEG